MSFLNGLTLFSYSSLYCLHGFTSSSFPGKEDFSSEANFLALLTTSSLLNYYTLLYVKYLVVRT